MKTIRPIVLGVALTLSLANANAENDSSQQVKLGTGSRILRDALIDWAQQTGYQIVLPSTDVVSQLLVTPTGASLKPKAALQQLLAGTPLTFEWLDERTVAIRERARSPITKTIWNMQTVEPTRMPVAFADDAAANRSEGGTSVASEQSQGAKGFKQGSLEEVIVTAQKRRERLQDVPISITALNGADLDRSTVEGVTDALRRVPGVFATVPRSGGTQLTMRGVSANSMFANGSSAIAYYLDSIPFGFVRQAAVPDANAYDLERVEALRGPQGTLYGASALNGVVRVLTKDANPDEFEFKARTSVATTTGGDESYRGDFAANVPIIDEKLAARAVIGYQDVGGWADRPNKENANDGEISSLRLKVNALPTEQLSIALQAWISRSDFNGLPTADNNDRQGALVDEPVDTDFDAYSLKIGYDFRSFSVTSMTSYLEYSNFSTLDLSILNNPQRFDTDLNSDVLSEEVTLSSTGEGSWRWSAGGIYREGEDRRATFLHPYGVTVRPFFDQSDKSTSFAVFGELTRLLVDRRLELTAGLRYFEDKVETWENYNSAGLPLIQTEAKFDAVTPRVVVTWHASDELTMYASYAEGFRSGFDQSVLVKRSNPNFPPMDADTLTNYEMGAKGNLADGRVNFEIAAYYIEWEGVQQSLTVVTPISPVPLTANVNGETATGLGVDVGLTARFGGLSVGVNGSWNDLTRDEDVYVLGVLLFDEGSRLNFSPEYTAGAFADYTFPLGRTGFDGSFSTSANYVSETPSSPFLAGGVRQNGFPSDSLMTVGASFSVRAREHWAATAFVDNLTNERGSSFYDIGAPSWSVRLRPRTMGLQLEYKF